MHFLLLLYVIGINILMYYLLYKFVDICDGISTTLSFTMLRSVRRGGIVIVATHDCIRGVGAFELPGFYFRPGRNLVEKRVNLNHFFASMCSRCPEWGSGWGKANQTLICFTAASRKGNLPSMCVISVSDIPLSLVFVFSVIIRLLTVRARCSLSGCLLL